MVGLDGHSPTDPLEGQTVSSQSFPSQGCSQDTCDLFREALGDLALNSNSEQSNSEGETEEEGEEKIMNISQVLRVSDQDTGGNLPGISPKIVRKEFERTSKQLGVNAGGHMLTPREKGEPCDKDKLDKFVMDTKRKGRGSPL